MAVQTAVSVAIGATLGNNFTNAFSSADKQLSTLGQAIKNLNTNSKNITAYKELGRQTLQSKKAWGDAEQEVSKLATALATTNNPTKQLVNSFDKAKKSANFAKTAYTQNRSALSQMSATLKTAGIDTKNLTQEQTSLGKTLATLQKHQNSLLAVQSKQQANITNRNVYRSQMMDLVALGTAMYGMLQPAIAFESAMADVKKVVDFESPKALWDMENSIKQLSAEIPLSLEGLTQIVAAGGQLGVPRAELTTFAETASKMSVAFDMTADEAGQSMAKLSNVLQVPISDMSKVGDVMNHLSNNIAATAPEIVEVALRAGSMGKSFGLAHSDVSALAGTFLALGKTPEIAGTAINMITSRLKLLPVSTGAARAAFDDLGISMSEYTKLVENGQGKDALMMVLESMSKLQGVKRSQVMKDIFGENATRQTNALVESLDVLKANFELVSDETEIAGSMEREFAARSATTANNLQLFKNQISILATNIGSVLLPALNTVVRIFGKAANSLSEFAEKHPTLIKYIGLTVAGMASLKIAGVALGYGFTFLKGGTLSIINIFTRAKTAFSLVKFGLGTLVPIIKTVGMAIASNPIGLIITGIALGAGLIIKYWKPISGFFKDLFTPVVDTFKGVWNWINRLWEKAKNIFENVKSWLADSWIGKAWDWAFRTDETTTAATPSIGETVSVINGLTETAPAVELPSGKISTNNMSNVSVSAPITINATTGMDATEIARQVAYELNKREQDAQRRLRSANYD